MFRPLDTIDDSDLLGWRGGFDVVLGNPPWETFELKEQEWFAERRPEIEGPQRRRPVPDDRPARRG